MIHFQDFNCFLKEKRGGVKIAQVLKPVTVIAAQPKQADKSETLN